MHMNATIKMNLRTEMQRKKFAGAIIWKYTRIHEINQYIEYPYPLERMYAGAKCVYKKKCYKELNPFLDRKSLRILK